MPINQIYSRGQLIGLVVLRLLIGWYFLYEGLIKFLNPGWTSYAYLLDSKGLLAGVFIWITEVPVLLTVVNLINIYGLIFIGLSLMLGIYMRIGSIFAATLISLYYLSHPPLIQVQYLFPFEGNYVWVDKNLIILSAVIIVFLFPTSHRIGLDRLRYVNKDIQ
jgi:thiosulfate dehydrogenase (quinone) large subunit